VALQVLSGEDEARLTFLAVRRWFGWSSGTLLVVDIGGGSLELAAGMDEDPDAAVSLPLGAGRLTRDLLPGDPPTAEVVRQARRTIRLRLAAAMRPLAKAGIADRAVGTSKTMRSLARATGAAPSSDGPYAARSLERAALASLVTDLGGMSAQERERLSGVSASRSRQLLAGALVAEAAMDLLDLERLEICPWALREGVILSRLDAMR
jgi:exopolyphosphatase / guanosine-5'-triphosphate,3'-diphosphate pyrophosphatase